MTRPSETITAAVGSIVGAVLILVGAFAPATGSKIDAGVAGAITLLVSWIATAVTAYVASKQRAGTKSSGPAGEVKPTGG